MQVNPLPKAFQAGSGRLKGLRIAIDSHEEPTRCSALKQGFRMTRAPEGAVEKDFSWGRRKKTDHL